MLFSIVKVQQLFYERKYYSLNTHLWCLLEASFLVFRSESWDRVPAGPELDWKKFFTVGIA
jgi:hypothetical protein